jgi:hypothetical protein
LSFLRDHLVKEALDKAVGPFRPEKTLRSRLKRTVAIAVLALLAVAGFVGIIHYSAPRPAPPGPAAKPAPIEVQLLPPKR